MKSARLTRLESLFNLRKSTAREMAKQTSFPAPSAPGREAQGSTGGCPSLRASLPKMPRAGSHQPSWASRWEVAPGTYKTRPGMQSTGEGKSPFWESHSLCLSLKIWLFLKAKIIKEKRNRLFHISWFGFFFLLFIFSFLLTFLLTSVIKINARTIF